MYSALDIANYIIEFSKKIGAPVSNLKLQKLLYYVQAAFLVECNKKCFREKILAWNYGPVVKEVYDYYKGYGRENILSNTQYSELKFDFRNKKIVKKQQKVDRQATDLIEKVVVSYKDIQNPFKLVEKTHNEEPWRQSELSKEISVNLIQDYYRNNKSKIYGYEE